MTPEKPDRFERIVKACYFNDRSDAADAIKLLRAQHMAVVRMVKAEMNRYRAENSEACLVNGAGEFAAIILKKLNERAK